MNQQTAVIIGATGLTGSLLLEQLLNDDAFSTVRILVRKPVSLQHPKLQTVIVDFNNYFSKSWAQVIVSSVVLVLLMPM